LDLVERGCEAAAEEAFAAGAESATGDAGDLVFAEEADGKFFGAEAR